MSEYIMNRESLKRHCEAMCHKFKDIHTSGTYGEHRLVLELLEQTEWIPVSEKLPEDNGEYLATIYDTDENYKYMDIAEWEDGIWQYKDYIKVLAWIPLPKLYESQESEVNNGQMFSLLHSR